MSPIDHSLVYLMTGFGACRIVVMIVGLVICLRNRWLSPAMWLIIGGLGATVAISVGQYSYNNLLSMFGFMSNVTLMYGFAAVFALAQLIASIVLVVGMALVLKDVRDRFQKLRELHEGDRAESVGGIR